MNDRMQEQMNQQQPRRDTYTTNQTGQEKKVNRDEYIDFEEVK